MKNLHLKIDLLELQIEVLEIENRLPSFKVELQINLLHPTGKFNYSANDIWFECYNWDNFIKKIIIINGNDDNIILNSMSEQFILKLSINEIDILIKEVYFKGLVTELKHHQKLTQDDLFKLKESFLGFDKWW